MPIPSVEDQVNAILSTRGAVVNYPHPHKVGKRIVGWVIDEEKIGLGTAILAVEEIQRRAKQSE